MGDDNEFLHDRAAELVERVRKKQENDFEFHRLAGAADALLEASERIFDSRKHRSHSRESQRDAAMALQRYYFRSQQAEYFAELSQEPEADAYVQHCRRLYQEARSAYDAEEFKRAKLLGEASALIVRALENIAQASVHIPEPPVIK